MDRIAAGDSDRERRDAALSRHVSAFARAEFQAPVEAISGLATLLVEDWSDAASRGDLEKLTLAADKLATLVKRLFDPATSRDVIEGHDAEEASSLLRHDLRTPITAILGYGELLAEELGPAHETQAGILADLIGAARRLLDQIDAMVAYMRRERDGPASEGNEPFDADAGLHEPKEALRAVLTPPLEPVARATGRILIADDNASTLDLLARRLVREGHEVTLCPDGETALHRLETERFDLLLLDLLMPGLNGIEVMRRARARPETAMLPVIIVSALDEIEGAVRCIEEGADDFLSKPINPVLLRARISASLERKFLRDRDEARARQLRAEQERSENLLLNVLPRSVVSRLRSGATVIADRFESATILFSDLVDFTETSAHLRPDLVLDLLNRIFSRFDRLAADHGLEKIKTIGDAYMAAGGLPEPHPDHAGAAAAMALRMPGAVADIGRTLGLDLRLRVGLNTGPVAAGIIGRDKFIYDVWGDTVNLASRMETTGEPGRVQITAATRLALGDRFAVEPRAAVEVKGCGRLQTFLLAPLPDRIPL